MALTKKSLSLLYMPGVGEAVKAIRNDTKAAYTYTMKGNSVAIVTDGSRVLGLGNCGPEAALPVMEGKAMLFKTLANIDAFPLCLKTQDADEIISLVKNVAPAFGGINLEDIAPPRCFEIEGRLQDIGIPVMHDDQHGTAIAILGGLINAARAAGKPFEELRVAVSGAGAAGTAIAKLLVCMEQDASICRGVQDVIVCDSKGILHRGRDGLDKHKTELARATNKSSMKGSLRDAMAGADAFIGLSAGGIVTEKMVKSMATSPVVFALANPTPEIMPSRARRAGARLIATGRSDFPNQVNNLLAFPGVFRGALDARAPRITNRMKLLAARAVARTLKKPTARQFLPSVFDKRAVKNVAAAAAEAQ